MIAPSHIAGGLAAYFAVSIFAGNEPGKLDTLVAAVFSVIPADIDKRAGIAGRHVPRLAGWLEFNFSHRTITHSLLAQAVAAGVLVSMAAVFSVIPLALIMAVLVPWVTHSWLDMMTPSGCRWFWPARVHCVFPGNLDYRMEIMGLGEFIFTLIMAVSAWPLHNIAAAGADAGGLVGLAREQLATMPGAINTYTENGGPSWEWRATISGYNRETAARISGTYEVIAQGGAGFLLRSDDSGLVNICSPQHNCDWFVTSIKIRRGEKLNIKSIPLRINELQGQELQTALAPIVATGADVYINGQWTIGNEQHQLQYAEPADVPSEHLIAVNITIQVRQQAGAEDIPEFRIKSEPLEPPATDQLLRKWL